MSATDYELQVSERSDMIAMWIVEALRVLYKLQGAREKRTLIDRIRLELSKINKLRSDLGWPSLDCLDHALAAEEALLA